MYLLHIVYKFIQLEHKNFKLFLFYFILIVIFKYITEIHSKEWGTSKHYFLIFFSWKGHVYRTF